MHSQNGGVGEGSYGSSPLDAAALSSDIQFDTNSVRTTMFEALAQLLDAEICIHQRTSVRGTFFIEVMAGECVITLGAMLKRAPWLRPWDAIYGEAWNVLTHGEILVRLAEDGRIDPWLALPRQSFTFSRDPGTDQVSLPNVQR